MRTHIRLPLIALLLLVTAAACAGPPPGALTVTLPDAGEYTYWVQAKAGAVSVLPTTISNKKTLILGNKIAAGDTLYILDAHTGEVAAHLLAADPKGGLQPISTTVGDFKAIHAPSPPTPSPLFPANTSPPSKPASTDTGSGIGKLLTWLFGLIVAIGVGWVIWQLYKTRGAPLLTLARRVGVEVPDPTPIDAEADAPAPVYTPPAPRPLEKIPDEAGIAPPPAVPVSGARAWRASHPGVSLSDVPQLVGIQGLAAGSVFALSDGEVTIGRDGDNQIVLAESTVSRRHARVARDPSGRITISDNGSANGIYINGERITQTLLNPGDEIKIGDNYFRFEG